MKKMEILLPLCICLSFFITSCVGFQIQLQSSSHTQQVISTVDGLHFHPSLPRKLRLLLAPHDPPIYVQAQVHPISNNNHQKHLSGTRQEWVERADTSEFFTMDYSRVRRRRPIHNKSLPAAP
ncbi:uncharacterized protein LOC126675061 isoform X2 [Mercurialis annua]|uniref:uncharacterized protein LOC126675061 isoform X2 n=1 Tax=Mercurialis annua TaxID=3986 RepID=UPI0021606E00|nr:uncharacterized protein LOC126675061 isoform X2 [Mercurialis annua]